MIRMSLDQETVLHHEVSSAFPAAAALSEQQQLAKSHPLRPKNGLHPPGDSQPPITSAPPTQRLAKRRFSMGVGFRGLAKRRRRANSDSQSEPVLPSHFLLGGNIFDPLNLNSLLDEDVNKATNQETPKSSPLPSRGGDPVEILVPRDITDPLNLKGENVDGKGAEGVLLSPLKSRRRHRNRHHGGGGGGGGGGGEREVIPARLFPSTAGPTVPLLTTEGSVAASPLPCELNTAITCRDDIAPPPILPRRHTHPPPGSTPKPGDSRQRRRRRTTSARSADCATSGDTTGTLGQPTKFQTPLVGGAKAGRCGGLQTSSTLQPQKKKDKHRYQCGNYSCYYGYHGFYGDRWEGRIGAEEDPRLRLLEADWFRDKKVLDIGCGAGHMTLAIARRFDPAHILGVELDKRLVHAAKQNIRHFLSHDLVVEERKMMGTRTPRKGGGRGDGRDKEEEEVKREVKEEEEEVKREVKEEEEVFQQALSLLSLPLSFRVSRGPVSAPPLLLLHPSSSASRFPINITFIQGDYVSEQEVWPAQGQYDVITCLGVTKWVQLQSGDVGVVRLFRRAYQSLSPGGLFILEPQPWKSYSRSKRASEATYRHYRTVRLRPEQFTSYLTDSVGFTSYRLLTHTGNQRPIYLFHKGPAQRK